jgi:hypothetical protein
VTRGIATRRLKPDLADEKSRNTHFAAVERGGIECMGCRLHVWLL